ncbi:unnamed protein product [Dibothriocephalus latus]|uniref:Uncharacterized protein n=1 Tax=Dibothriocephalus latus TaxID=60516 RepID=A0A3P6QWN4_DIBLA|nr:unnamed protein product [Dibothriocephalus latus]
MPATELIGQLGQLFDDQPGPGPRAHGNSLRLVQRLRLPDPVKDSNNAGSSYEFGRLVDDMKNRLLDWHPYLQLSVLVDETARRLEVRALNGRNWSNARSKFSSTAYLTLRVSPGEYELASKRKDLKNDTENIVLNEKVSQLGFSCIRKTHFPKLNRQKFLL